MSTPSMTQESRRERCKVRAQPKGAPRIARVSRPWKGHKNETTMALSRPVDVSHPREDSPIVYSPISIGEAPCKPPTVAAHASRQRGSSGPPTKMTSPSINRKKGDNRHPHSVRMRRVATWASGQGLSLEWPMRLLWHHRPRSIVCTAPPCDVTRTECQGTSLTNPTHVLFRDTVGSSLA